VAGPLKYRLFRPADLPAVSRLWADEAGWGELTADTWRKWYEETPHGPCLVMVAADGDDIVGQIVFTPSAVRVGGKVVRGLRLSAPIIRKGHRGAGIRSLGHPAIMLWLSGSIAAAAKGYSLVYALPEEAWMPFFRWVGRFESTEFGCVAVPLQAVPTPLRGWTARPVAEFGTEHEEIWQAWVEAVPVRCGVERSAAWLRYRNAAHLCIEARDAGTGSLAGYVCIHRKSGLVSDLAARSPADVAPVLATALQGIADAPGTRPPFDAVRAMDTPALGQALREVGFAPVDYRFGFAVDALDPDLTPADVAPSAWYVMPSD
jgi:predicted N-acetyltransferase YhbS